MCCCKGYYDNDAATSAAFRAGGGWFDTGDLGWRAPQVSSESRALTPGLRAVFDIVTGEPFKQSAELTGEPIKMKGLMEHCAGGVAVSVAVAA